MQPSPENMTIDQARNVRLEIKDKFTQRREQVSRMNTKQLWNALCLNPLTNNYFDGIYSSDTLKEIEGKPNLIICNTDPSTKPGEHWVLFFFNEISVDFFDSLGRDIKYLWIYIS